jgi:hypothetical protein
MSRLYYTKVTLIKRRQLWFSQPFDHCEDCGIHEAEREVGVPST